MQECTDLEETHKKRKKKLDDHEKTSYQSHFKGIKECIKQFHSCIAVGPLFVCTCCHQTWFRKGVCMLNNINLPTSSRLYCTKFTSVNDEEWICHTCMGAIRDGKVPKLSVANGMKPEQSVSSLFPSPESTISAPGKGKLRYVGGYCVGKVRYRLCKIMRNCLFVPGMTPEINKMQEQINILDDMTISAADILTNTIYEETLAETARKQNTAEGLTNICDNVFEFFEMIEQMIRSLLTMKTLSENRKYLFKYVIQQLLSNKALFQAFSSKCCNRSVES